MTAANYVYSVAKPDGLSVVLPNNSIYIEQLVGRKEAQFDLRKFHWIGSASQDSIIFYMRADTPFKTVGDIIKAKQPPSCGGSGTTSSDYLVAKILDLALGAKINPVLGYPGGAEADLAVEKGEIVCRAHTLASHFGREPFNSWHKKGFDRHLLQSGRKRDPRAPEAPTIHEILDEFKVSSQQPQGRPGDAFRRRIRPAVPRYSRHAAGSGENPARVIRKSLERSGAAGGSKESQNGG